jgi:gamma-glutamyltranspeptidase/glutathione hydrolase
LAAVQKRGSVAFYTGAIAKELVRAVRAEGGILDERDLADYVPVWRRPLTGLYRGHRVVVMAPPSSGGVAILQTLNVLEALSALHGPLAALGFGSSAYLHRLAEALKHAYADRARWLGDPDFVRVPVDQLTDRTYAKALAAKWRDERVLLRDQYGSTTPPRAATPDAGTSHLSVVDPDGNAVALTTTINYYFGSQLVAGSTGVLLNNEMDDFAARPGEPNVFGLTQSENNAVAPHKRPLSSMSPTLVFNERGALWLVVGAAGGPTIITGTLQTLLGVVEFGLNIAQAVAAPRVHTQWLPDKLFVEPEFPRDVLDALTRRGHGVAPSEFKSVVQAIEVRPDGIRAAASDPRTEGRPAVY